MKTIRKLIFASTLICVSTVVMAEDYSVAPKSVTKIGSNVAYLMLLGDVNVSLERQISKYISVTSSLHYIPTANVVSKGTGFRASAGIAAYTKPSLSGNFIELKVAANKIETNDKNGTEDNGPLSGEIYAGYSGEYNESMFYSGKVGFGRYIQNGAIVPVGALTLGFLF